MFQRTKGFTLIELIISIAILAVLLALAVPSFSGSINKSRAESEASDIIRALNYTRLEAINRGVNVRLLPAIAGTSWASDLNTKISLSGLVLRVVPAMSSTATVAATAVTYIEFNNLGGLASPAAQVTLTFTEGTYTNTVNVCLTGRIVLNGNCL